MRFTATVTFAETSSTGGCSGSGGIVRTWTAKDACGNTSVYVQTITVIQDTTRPTINGVPENINVSCSGEVPEANINAVTVSDNCNGTVRISVSDEIVNKNCDNQYTIHRTWTATDVCGNSNTAPNYNGSRYHPPSVYGRFTTRHYRKLRCHTNCRN